MAASSPTLTPARPAAAAHGRAQSVGPSRVSLTSRRSYSYRYRSTPPRWSSLPRCSRGGGKPVVTDEAAPEIKGNEENEAIAGRGAPGWFRLDGVAVDILAIASPAVLALAADPITALVGTAFVGLIGSAQLAAIGASTSIFNLVSKLFNVPLLIAEQKAKEAILTPQGRVSKSRIPFVF